MLAVKRVDVSKLRADIALLERKDYANLKSETLKLAGEVEKLQQKMREDLQRLQATTRLDFNLERGRVFDEQVEYYRDRWVMDLKVIQLRFYFIQISMKWYNKWMAVFPERIGGQVESDGGATGTRCR